MAIVLCPIYPYRTETDKCCKLVMAFNIIAI